MAKTSPKPARPQAHLTGHTQAQLQALFMAQKRLFVERFPWCAQARLVVHDQMYSPGSPGSYRDVAWAAPSTMTVNVVKRVKDLATGELIGLFCHELGHLADRDSDKPGAEARADALAQQVTGRKILYDDKDLQNVYHGKAKRPRYLHQ